MNFEKAKDTYRKHALVQKNMASALIFHLIKSGGKDFEKILEIGAGTGFFTDEIALNLSFKEIILNDITENFTGHNFKFIQGDASKINFGKNFDLVASNAALQWIEDIEAFFVKTRNSLKKGGILAFSSFGFENFKQFKILTGRGLDAPSYTKCLQNSGFKILDMEEVIQTLYFENVKEILGHVKSTGVALSGGGVWTKGKLLNFEKLYFEKFHDKNGYALTYNPLFVVARAI